MPAPPSAPGTPAAKRLAALEAAEARLKGQPNPNTPEAIKAARPTPPAWEPTEKGDKNKRFEFTRLLDRGVVRDNGYRQAAECVETLLKISTNILDNSDEAKYRNLKASNAGLKNKVLLAKGGSDYLIALGFRTTTQDFEKYYTFDPTVRRIHELRIGRDVLAGHLSLLQSRIVNTTDSSPTVEEAARKARALREYEHDRELVKERAAREKIAREARMEREKREAEQEAQRADEEEAALAAHQGQASEPIDTRGGRRLNDETSVPTPGVPGEYPAGQTESIAPLLSPNTNDSGNSPTASASSCADQPNQSSSSSASREHRPRRQEERHRARDQAMINASSGVQFAPVDSAGFDSIMSGMISGGRTDRRTNGREMPGSDQLNQRFIGTGSVLGGPESDATIVNESDRAAEEEDDDGRLSR